MNAFPMLERCFEAQWRGLSESERAYLRSHPGEVPFVSNLEESHTSGVVIWSVVNHPDGPLILISVKTHAFPGGGAGKGTPNEEQGPAAPIVFTQG
jgi:hypothetical protein